MKLAKADVGFQSRGVQSKTTYQVAQTAKVMDMFSNMLYKDKIRAVIRELSTNAWDAHVMAGTTDKVPNMHLPSHTDPEFRLRDFGTGLSPAALEEMYQTYGASNKTHSNDFNGCMGIGSKSPFAYANSFVTTSYYNGKKYVYVNAKDRSGMPSMQKMLEEDTNEVNGLEISFAVDRKDIDEFKNKAADLLRRFPKEFNIFCTNGKFELKKDDYVHEGTGWKIRRFDYYHKDSYAIMGNVAYPIDPAKFDYQSEDLSEKDKTAWYQHYKGKADNGSRTRKFYTDILNLGLDIEFEVGEVEMDISREGLQYTKQTVDVIKKKLDEISDKVETEISDSIKNAKCTWEAALKLSDVMSGHFKNLRMLVDVNSITYHGKKVPTQFNIKVKESTIVYFYKDSYVKIPKRTDNVSFIDVAPKTAFMIADKKVGNYVAVERFILNNKDKYSHVYLIKPKDMVKAINEIKDIVGCTDEYFFYASSVPVPKGVAKKADTQKVFKFKYIKGSPNNYYRESYFDKVSVDINTGGLYVEINNWNTRVSKLNDFSLGGHTINNILDLLQYLDITVPDVYCVKSSTVNKFEDHSGWSCFFTWAKDKIDDYVKTSNIKDELIELNSYKNWGEREYFSGALSKLVPKIENQKSILVEVLDIIKNCDKLEKKVGDKVTKIRKACDVLNFTFDSVDNNTNSDAWDKVTEKMYEKYPVLHLMNRWDYGYSEKLKIVVDIIDMIDSCEGN